MATNVLDKDVVIEGSIKFSGDFALDCKVDGEVTSESGNLTLNKNAAVKGNVKASQVNIHGKVEGSVVAHTCELKSTADVQGDLAYKTIAMEPGAKMVGSAQILS